MKPTSALENFPAAARRDLEGRMAALARTAYHQQGKRAFESPRTHAAAHEAGHCVANALVGCRVVEARIWKRRAGWEGETRARPEDVARLTVLQRAQVAASGLIAELVLVGADTRLGSSLDEQVAAEAMLDHAGADVRTCLDAWRAALEAQRAPLAAVQEQLLREGRVRPPKLDRLLAPVRA